MQAGTQYDVVVVGAGAVGCAIARELSVHRLRVGLLEARSDVGAGTSKANTALLHTGFDAAAGSLEARLVSRGHRLLSAYADEAGIPLEPVGALLVAWDEAQSASLAQVVEQGQVNGIGGLRRLSREALHRLEPALGPGAEGAVLIDGEGLICPFTATLAYATEALAHGCELRLRSPVVALESTRSGLTVQTPTEEISTRWLVNAAGLHSDEIDRMAGFSRFNVTPRRGQLLVFDKQARTLINHIVLAVPTGRTKGVLVSPTVYGNVMVGPTAEDVADKTATETTRDGLEYLHAEARRIVPALADYEVTAAYAGLRAATEHKDYRFFVDRSRRYICAGGIRSTGISASMAIAELVREELAAAGVVMGRPDRRRIARRMPNIGEASPRPYQRPELIAENPAYGQIVCFCERVTRGEIRDALASPIAPSDLDGLRRRTRVLMGRCQGFFCRAQLERMMDESVSPSSGCGR